MQLEISRIGNSYVLLKDRDRPIITFGPHYPIFILTFILFFTTAIIIATLLSNSIYLFLSILTSIAHLSNYFWVASRNPGIVLEQVDEEIEAWFCKYCASRRKYNTHHCNDCGVCIEGWDHHCPWIGKCIGKGNIDEFYSFIYSTLVFMILNITLLV